VSTIPHVDMWNCEIVDCSTNRHVRKSTNRHVGKGKQMRIIAIIGQKGGTGKTTTTIGLAVAAVRAGFQSAILDLDPQSNAANWKDRREAEGPAVESIQPGRLRQTLKAAEDAGADYVFIDTPGKSDTAAVEAARV
jgi:chromosome partitioning protein